MKTNYLLILLVCFSQMLMSQTMKIYKTDQTILDYKLTDIDSIKISTSPNGNIISTSNWICFTNCPSFSIIKPSIGIYEKVNEGLKVFGSGNLYDKPVQLMPILQNSIMAKTIYLKWKVNGNMNNVNVGVELYSEHENLISAGKILSLSSKLAESGSVQLSDNTWYYTRISITSGIVTSVTSTNNYE
jgi:hypothetical protein